MNDQGQSGESLDVNDDVCQNCGRPRRDHAFTRGGARCGNGRQFKLARPQKEEPMSEYISNVGPDFYVGGGKKRLSFQRVIDGPEEGSVSVSLVIDGEIHSSTVIDAAGWASVLAHLSAAPHDGDTYAVALDFHAGRIVPGRTGG